MDLILIAAIGQNGEMGLEGQLPWHHPEDLRFFKETTKGSPLIMGRKTFESLPGVLKGRPHLVLSQATPDSAPPNVFFFQSWADIQEWCRREHCEKAFVIGGRQIYALLAPYCNILYITHIHSAFLADTVFPMEVLERFTVFQTIPLDGPSFTHYNAEVKCYRA